MSHNEITFTDAEVREDLDAWDRFLDSEQEKEKPHSIAPNTLCGVLSVKIAFNSTHADEIDDNLFEILSGEVERGFIADYQVEGLEPLKVVRTSSSPQKGELFNKLGLYLVIVSNAGSGEQQLTMIEASEPIDTYSANDLLPVLSKVMGRSFTQCDTITVKNLGDVPRLTLDAE